jgi:tetratricopeptide (TPR) repeat protein
MEAGRLEGPLPDGMPSLEFSAALLRADGFEGLRVMRESAAAAAKLDDDPGSPWYAPARAALGVSLYLSGDAPAAAVALEQAVSSQAADPPTRMFCLTVAALVAAEQGGLPQAVEFARAAREIMESAGLTDTAHGSLVWTASAVIHSGQGRPAQAQAELERALRARQQASGITTWPALAILLRLTALLLDLGDPPAARELIAQATAVMHALPAVSGRTSPAGSWPGNEQVTLALFERGDNGCLPEKMITPHARRRYRTLGGRGGFMTGRGGYPLRYRIVVQGECGTLLAGLGDNVHVESARGDTSFVVSLRDEAEFWGLLDRLQDLALHLVSLHELDPPEGAG